MSPVKFRKKPVVIEAMQLLKTQQSFHACYCFIYGQVDNTSCRMAEDYWSDYVSDELKKGVGIRLKTMESDNETQIASFGDWIIKGVAGEFYPCKPDIFAATYEEI